MKLDIRKIALYLVGSLPPYYGGNKKVKFIRQIQQIDSNTYSNENLDFFFRQAKNNDEEFYFMILEDFIDSQDQSNENIIKLFEKLKLPKEIYKNGIGKLELNNEYKDEEEFTKDFLIPFFKALGYIDVRYNHGTDEKGKDIVMKKIDDLGEYKYIGVQAKLGDIDAKANKTGITNIITQTKKGFENDYDDLETNKKVRISEYFIVCDGKITEKAIDEIMNIEPTYFKNNIHFIDKTKIKNLLDIITNEL